MWKGIAVAAVLGIVVGIGLAWLAFSRTVPRIENPSTATPPPVRSAEPEPAMAPIRSLADIAAVVDDFERNAALYDLLLDAGTPQVMALLDEVQTLPSNAHRFDVARVLYIRFASVDPEAAADHVTGADHRPSWVVAVYRAWAHADLEAAVSHAATLDSTTRAHAMRAFFELDLPDWRLETLAKQLDGEAMLAAIRASEERPGDDGDFASAWQSALGVQDEERLQRLANLALVWVAEDPVAAMEAASSIKALQLSLMVQTIAFRKWVEDDPSAAIAWLAGKESTFNVQPLTQTVMATLSNQGMAHAISFLDTMPDRLRNHGERGLISVLMAYNTRVEGTDLDTLLNWYETIKPERQEQLAGSLAMGLADHDPDRALAWVASLERRVGGRAMNGLIGRVAHNDPALAKRMVDRIEDTDLLVVAARAVANTEALQDARDALEWASSLSNEAARIAAVSAAFGRWSNVDPDGAAGDLLDLPSGDYRDAIVTRVAPVLQYERRFDLLERLYESAESAEARQRIGGMLYHHYTETDPDPQRAEDYREYESGS